ncbi:MAG: HEAT repeat domain-containing protein [Phycisphaerae bacterium]|nr:HEAT repeat domain-containing protein [Phycisphaerae bacterium]
MDQQNARQITQNALRSKTLAAAAALGSGRSSGYTEMAQIMTLLHKPDPNIRRTAIKALEKIRGPQAVTLISRCLNDKTGFIRKAACKSLGKLRAHSAKVALLDCLNDKDPSVCCCAAEALFAMGDKSGLNYVKKLVCTKGSHQLEALAVLNELANTKYSLTVTGIKEAQKWIGYKRNWLFRF